MDLQELFDFESNISNVDVPIELNNPFSSYVPAIAKIAAAEFQEFITKDSVHWKYDFQTQKGKMFGVLVVQTKQGVYKYLGAISGMYPENANKENFAPSVFDVSADDFFINSGMIELTEIGAEIKNSDNQDLINALRKKRRMKSIALQRKLFENYDFVNLSNKQMNLIDIFEQATNGLPPSAAGECAAPKLIQFAIKHGLKPLAITEFWWGRSNKQETRKHLEYYPACKDKCKPILEFLLEDDSLYDARVTNET